MLQSPGILNISHCKTFTTKYSICSKNLPEKYLSPPGQPSMFILWTADTNSHQILILTLSYTWGYINSLPLMSYDHPQQDQIYTWTIINLLYILPQDYLRYCCHTKSFRANKGYSKSVLHGDTFYLLNTCLKWYADSNCFPIVAYSVTHCDKFNSKLYWN